LIDGNQAFWDLFRTEMNCQWKLFHSYTDT
jgi:hypothetical protein